MITFKKHIIQKILLITFWVALAGGCIILTAAAIRKNESKLCKGIDIQISGKDDNFFIDKHDVTIIIKSIIGKEIIGKPINAFNLVAIEKELKKAIWIKKAELFFDNNGVLQAKIEERLPIARIFTVGGNSYYIDSSRMMLPLSDNHAARLPVFTNFPSELNVLSKQDSNLLVNISSISQNILNDNFLMAMIDQIAITNERHFEMIPKIGDQLIIFGDANNQTEKFDKLRLFYKKLFPQQGINKYSLIDLHYKNQVVAKLKGKEDVIADSLRTIQYMKALAAYSAKMASDSSQTISEDNAKNSTDISFILESLQRDEVADPSVSDLPATFAKPAEKKDSVLLKSVVPVKTNKIVLHPGLDAKKTPVADKTKKNTATPAKQTSSNKKNK